MKRFHSDQSHLHQFSGFCLRRLQSATQNCVWNSYRFPCQILLFLNQQIITEGIANDATDYSYWDRERSLNALEREQRGRWPWSPVCKCQVPNAKRLECVNNKIFESVWFSAALVYWLIQDQSCVNFPKKNFSNLGAQKYYFLRFSAGYFLVNKYEGQCNN